MGDGAASCRSGQLAGLGLIIASCRRCTRAWLTGRSTIWPGVFTLLLLLLLALVAGVDHLGRVLAIPWVQPEPFWRHLGTVLRQLWDKDVGVGVVGDRRSPLDDSRPRRLQLRVGLLPPGGQLVQTQLGIPGLGELQRPPGAGPSRRRLLGLEAADRHLQPVGSPTGGAGNHFVGQRAANICAPTR